MQRQEDCTAMAADPLADVVSSGVLHHRADPKVRIRALAASLQRDGVAAIMLYARHGRTDFGMMQAVFRELGLRQDEASLAAACAVSASAKASAPAARAGYLGQPCS